MKAFKRCLAMLLAILMMVSSMAFAEDEIVVAAQLSEEHIHVHEEDAAAIDFEAEPEEEEIDALFEIIEELPTEEAPADEEPVDEEPIEEAPVEDAPVEEVPAEEPEAEDEPVVEAPVEDEPAEEELVTEPTLDQLPELLIPAIEEETEITEEALPELNRSCEHYFEASKNEDGTLTFTSSCFECGDSHPADHTYYLTGTQKEYTGDAVDNGDGTHSGTYYPFEVYSCEDCGARIVYDSYGIGEPVVETAVPHDWMLDWDENGEPFAVCEACPAENTTCSHSDDMIVETDIRYHDYAPWTEGNVFSNNDGTHDLIGRYDATRTCTGCGADGYWYSGYYSEDLYEYTDLPCEYDSEGVCKYCNYGSDCDHNWYAEYDDEGNKIWYCYYCGCFNTCRHSWRPSGTYRSVEDATDNEDGTHDVTFYLVQENYCSMCGMWDRVYGEEPVTVTGEPHEWDYYHTENEDGERVMVTYCDYCDAESTCTHEDYNVLESGRTNFEAVDNGDGTHTATFNPDEYRECEGCGLKWWHTYPNTETVIEEHEWNSRGECYHCDAENPCTHPDAVEDGWSDYGNYIVHGEPTAAGHVVTLWRGTWYDCPDCGADYKVVSDTPSHVEALMEHEYDNDGECWVCGFINLCDHEGTLEEDHWYESNVEVHSKDAKTHTYSCTKTTVYLCTECGQNIYDYGEELYRDHYTAPHEFYNGECNVCDYENTCEHKDVTFNYGHWNVDYNHEGGYVVETTPTAHKVWVIEFEYGDCPDCGEQVYKYAEEAILKHEAHDFNSSGTCYTCDYVSTCEHTNTVVSEELYTGGNSTPVNAYSHVSNTRLVEVTRCLDCGFASEKTINTYPFLESHYFNAGGVCWNCGYMNACKHAKTRTYTSNYWDDAEYKNAAQHTINMRVMEVVECLDCGMEVSVKQTGNKTVDYNHSYNAANICGDCGHVSTCDHAKTTAVTDTYKYFKATSDSKHVQVTENYTSYQCNACKGFVSTLYKSDYTISSTESKHTLSSGVCTACHLRVSPASTCKTHKYVNCVCTNCGAVKHTFKGCICSVCKLEEHTWDGCECTKCDATRHTGLSAEELDCVCDECGDLVHDYDDHHWCARCQTCDHEHPYNDECNPCLWCGYTRHNADGTISTYVPVDYDRVDYHFHNTRYALKEYDYCTICGQKDEGTLVEDDFYIEEEGHTFWNGVCEFCGAEEGECEYSAETGNHEDRGNGVCKHCGICLFHFDGVEDDYKNEDLFYYDEESDEYWCNTCDSRPEIIETNDCAHKKTWLSDPWYTLSPDHPMTCEYLNAAQHVVKGVLVKQQMCEECGEVLTVAVLGETSEIRNHVDGDPDDEEATDPDGICDDCGAVFFECEHNNTEEEVYYVVDENVSDDADGHTFYGWELTDVYCLDCGEYVSEDEIEGASILIEGEHEFQSDWDDDGNPVYLCKYCGRESTCSHKWVSQLEARYDANYLVVDATYHSLYAEDEYGYFCSKCGVKNEDEGYFKSVVGKKEKHTFVNDVCQDCGYKLSEIKSIVVNYPEGETAFTVGVQMTAKLDLTIKPDDYSIQPKFTSSNTKVVTVSKDGEIKGLKKGTATITISTPDQVNKIDSVKVNVQVTDAPKTVTLNADSPKGGYRLCAPNGEDTEGQATILEATVSPASALYNLTWTTSNEAVAKIVAFEEQESIGVRAVAPGTATITVSTQNSTKSKKIQDTFTVKVVETPTGLAFEEIYDSKTLAQGMEFQLKPVFTPATEGADSGSYIHYLPNYEEISVSDSGLITIAEDAVPGEYKILATTYGLDTVTIPVEIMKAPKALKLNYSSMTVAQDAGIPTYLEVLLDEDEYTQVTWKSSNTKVVKNVWDDGLLNLTGKTGTATITATAHNGLKATCKVTVVKNLPTELSVTPEVINLAKGETLKLGYYFGKSAGTNLVYIEENDLISFVDGVENGDTIIANEAGSGTVEFYLEYCDANEVPYSDTVEVQIMPEIDAIEFDLNDFVPLMSVGQDTTFTVNRFAADGTDTIGAYTFSSDNTKVATIDQNGKLVAKAAGTATISVEAYNGVRDSFDLTVVAAPTKAYLKDEDGASVTKLTLGVGESFTLFASHDDAAAPTTYSFTGSNKNATIAAEGDACTITGAKVGTSTITLKTHNGKTAKCVVTVKAAPTKVELSKEEINLIVGESATISAKLNSSKAAGHITYGINGEGNEGEPVFDFDRDTGKITALAKGRGTLEAFTYNWKNDGSTPNLTDACVIRVSKAPEELLLGSLDMIVDGADESGHTVFLSSVSKPSSVKVGLYDEDLDEAYGDVNFTITSNGKAVSSKNATISKDGKLTFKKAGTYTITATAQGYYVDDETTPALKDYVVVKVVAAPTKVKLDKTKATIGVGEPLELVPSHENASAPTTYTFSSSNKKIAEVVQDWNEDGELIYRVESYKAGTVTLTVKTHNGKAATCKLTVKEAPTEISLSADGMVDGELNMAIDETTTLKATLGSTKEGGSVYWLSTDPNVFTVDENGKITPVAEGFAYAMGYTYNCHIPDADDDSGYSTTPDLYAMVPVTVWPVATSFEVSAPEVMSVGQKLPIEVTLYDADGNETKALKPATFKNNGTKTSVASVSASGVITAKKTASAAKFTVTFAADPAVTENVSVKIVAAPKIKLNKTSATLWMYKHQDDELLELVHDTNGAPATITYSSSNEKVATVEYYEEEGYACVMPVGPGTATITAKTQKGAKATCKVTVKVNPSAITVNEDTSNIIRLAVGESATLNVKQYPEGANESYTWHDVVNPDGLAIDEVIYTKYAAFSGNKVTAKAATAYLDNSVQVYARTYNRYEEPIESNEVHLEFYPAPTYLTLDGGGKTIYMYKDDTVDLDQEILRWYGNDGDEFHNVGKLTVSGLDKTEKKTVTNSGTVLKALKNGSVKLTVTAYNSTKKKPVKIDLTVKVTDKPEMVEISQYLGMDVDELLNAFEGIEISEEDWATCYSTNNGMEAESKYGEIVNWISSVSNKYTLFGFYGDMKISIANAQAALESMGFESDGDTEYDGIAHYDFTTGDGTRLSLLWDAGTNNLFRVNYCIV